MGDAISQVAESVVVAAPNRLATATVMSYGFLAPPMKRGGPRIVLADRYAYAWLRFAVRLPGRTSDDRYV